MSKTRYWIALILGLLAAFFISPFIAAATGTPPLIAGYMILSIVSILIWWCGWGVRFFILLTVVIGWSPVQFSHFLIINGGTISGFLGMIIILPCLYFFFMCFTAGTVILLIYSMLAFPFKVFTCFREAE